MRSSNILVLATQNRHKVEEFSTLLKPYPEYKVTGAETFLRNTHKLGRVETYGTYLENALAKARVVHLGCHYPTVADDSGLEVDALNGRPGIHSHRYAQATGGLSQDEANIQKLLQELKGNANRNARFVCSLVLLVEGVMLNATGFVEGTIIESPRGTNGFGFDPLFQPKGFTRTFAEMLDSEKNSISHRARALTDLMTQIRTNGIVLAKP